MMILGRNRFIALKSKDRCHATAFARLLHLKSYERTDLRAEKLEDDSCPSKKFQSEKSMSKQPLVLRKKKVVDSSAPSDKTMRLAKRIALSGVASRRESEKLILASVVKVNDVIQSSVSTTVTLNDRISVNGKPLSHNVETRVWLAHKLKGELVSDNSRLPTVSSSTGKVMPTIFDRFSEMGLGSKHLMPIGRLDFNTEGLLVLTNDGDYARSLEHPSNNIRRVYTAVVRGEPAQWKLDALKKGVTVDSIKYQPIEVKVMTSDKSRKGKDQLLRVTLSEGKNREVRKALASVKFVVKRLVRIEFGQYKLDKLPKGAVMPVAKK